MVPYCRHLYSILIPEELSLIFLPSQFQVVDHFHDLFSSFWPLHLRQSELCCRSLISLWLIEEFYLILNVTESQWAHFLPWVPHTTTSLRSGREWKWDLFWRQLKPGGLVHDLDTQKSSWIIFSTSVSTESAILSAVMNVYSLLN